MHVLASRPLAPVSATRVLYVEDDATVRTLGRMALEHIGGFKLAVCASTADVREVGPRFAPDVLLVDVRSPGVSSLSRLRAVRAVPELAEVPMVVMTGRVAPLALEAYRKAGAIGVIPKPFDPLAISAELRRFITPQLVH